MLKTNFLRKYLRNINAISLFLLHNNNSTSLFNVDNEPRVFPKVGILYLTIAFTFLHLIGYGPVIFILFHKYGINLINILFLYIFFLVLLLIINYRFFPNNYLNTLYEKSYNLKVLKRCKIMFRLVFFYVFIPAIVIILIISYNSAP